MNAITPQPSLSSNGARLVDASGHELPLRGTSLRAQAHAGFARVVVEQRFFNPTPDPMQVTYSLPLPADAAVAGYAFTLGDERFVAKVTLREDARERFEDAVLEGRSAALLEEDRSSLFTQELGNVPPGAEIVVEVEIDQPLLWLADGQWEWRFPTVVAPRFMGEPGRVADADRVTVDIADRPLQARASASVHIGDARVGDVHSPSHALQRDEDHRWAVAGEARLDRDVVIRWPVAGHEPGLTLSVGRPAAEHARADSSFGMLSVVPPPRRQAAEPVPRDVILLVDVSGSMHGEPLDQARRVLKALVSGLGPDDRLEGIAFSSRPQRWNTDPVAMTPANRSAALQWVDGLRAGGGTQMKSGIIEALAPLRPGAQRQVLVVTDGHIGFESEIVAAIVHRLPKGSRVHTLGVGHAVNRTLTRGAARAGAGCELVVAPGEDVEPLVARVLAEMAEPLLVDLELSGSALRSCGRARLPDLMAGHPTRIPVELDPRGGDLVLRAKGPQGTWVRTLDVPAQLEPGAGSAAWATLYAREQVDDLETRRAAGEGVDEALESVGLDFQIATRRTSFVAISTAPTVDATAPIRAVTMPHELAAGMSAEGVGLRGAQRIVGAIDLRAALPVAAAAPPAPAPRSSGKGRDGVPVGRASKRKMREEKLESQGRRRKPLLRRAPAAPAAPPHDADRGGAGGDGSMDDDEVIEVAEAPGRISITFQGTFIQKRERAVVTVTIDEDAPWSVEGVVAILPDGRRVPLEIDRVRSTAADHVEPGRTVRLVFAWQGAKPVRLEVASSVIIAL